MDALDIEGVFWLAQNPDDNAAGHLTFDAQNGVELNLIGSIRDVNKIMARRAGQRVSIANKDFLGARDNSVRIYGSTTKGPVTIEDCSFVGGSFPFGGPQRIPHEKYDGRAVFLGEHLSSDTAPLEFAGIKVSIRNLEYWVSKSGIRVVFNQENDCDKARLKGIDIDLPDNLAATTSTEEFKFSFEGKLHGDRIVQTIVDQKCHFSLLPTEPRSYESLLKACTSLQDLVTIGLDEPSVITAVSLRMPRSNASGDSDQGSSDWIRLYAKVLGSDIQPRKKSINDFNTIFTFDNIDGMAGVVQWMSVANRFDAVIGSLMRHWYIPSMYAQDRFFNSVVSAEALARIRTQEQNVNLRIELSELARMAGDVFSSIVGDVDSWSRNVVRVRDNNIVHIGLRKNIDSSRLYFLSESLYFLVVICLLRECGVPDEALAGIRSRERFHRLAAQVGSLN